jgi:hypothetical protein
MTMQLNTEYHEKGNSNSYPLAAVHEACHASENDTFIAHGKNGEPDRIETWDDLV